MVNLTAQQGGRSQWLHLGYDNLNRLINKRLNTTGGPLIAEYIYDTTDKGQLYASKAYDDSGLTLQVETQVLNRDDRYQITEQQMIVAGQGTFRMAYSYNAAGSQTSIQYPGDNSGGLGEIVTNQFNNVGQLNQVISGLDNTHFLDSATYQPSGKVANLRLDQGNNGAATSYNYDAGTLRLQQKQVTNGSGSTTVQDLSYGYDDASNVTSITDTSNSGQVQSFGYDWLNRLTSASSSSVGTGQYSHTYAYNAIGNLTNYNGASYTYSATQPHAVTAAHGNSYSYDGNGNQVTRTISGTAHTQTFDAQNRLVEVKQGSTVIGSFVYDTEGNRITGTVNGTTTIYIGGIFEYQSGATTTYYAGPTGPVALRRAGYAANNGIFYMLGDHLGSTSVLLNQDGTVAKQEYYYPFGGNRGTAFSDLTTKRFTGQYHEAGLPGGEGLSYYNARWYDAQLGRFISADTLVPSPGNPQNFNRLSYVNNNPLRFIDPSGHRPCEGMGNCAPPPRPATQRPATQSKNTAKPKTHPDNSVKTVKSETVTLQRSSAQQKAERRWVGSLHKPANHSFGSYGGPRTVNCTNNCNAAIHPGIDTNLTNNLNAGDHIYASATGTVVAIGFMESSWDSTNQRWRSAFGQYIIIEHLVGREKAYTVYAHLERDNVAVQEGHEVTRGEIIGGMGSTAAQGTVHLHYEIRRATAIDLNRTLPFVLPENSGGNNFFPRNKVILQQHFFDLKSLNW